MSERLVLDTERLRLTALSAVALQAWIDRDAAALRELTGVRFGAAATAPPLLEEDLGSIRDMTAQGGDELGWWAWLVSAREDDTPVGVCGLGGPPAEGTVTLGYSVYPHLEGRGLATEASRALVAWALAQPGVERVQATVPLWNVGSVAVARKLGMREIGRGNDPEVGEAAIYEVAG